MTYATPTDIYTAYSILTGNPLADADTALGARAKAMQKHQFLDSDADLIEVIEWTRDPGADQFALHTARRHGRVAIPGTGLRPA